MLVVGTNSYMTIDEANDIIDSLVSTDSLVSLWNNLSDKDKEAIIINVIEKYDNDKMEYIGVKKDKNQNLQFPRILENGDILECPYKIKKGLLLQGLSDLNNSTSAFGVEQTLRANGIKQFADGSGASITFSDASDTNIYVVGSGLNKNLFDMYFSDYSNIGVVRWL